MATDFPSPTSILKDLNELRHMALEKGNFTAALKATELLGREVGLFTLKKSSQKTDDISLDNLSEEDMLHLIQELEAKLQLDHRANRE